MPTTDLTVNGWTIYCHPLFLSALRDLIDEVRSERAANPGNYRTKRAFKMLVAIRKVAFEVIPADPTDNRYRQGETLGSAYKHWFRVKFLQQYRMYFRYHETRKIILIAWVNDDDSKRACGSRTDAYKVFAKMLKSGQPPDDWGQLLDACRAATTGSVTAGLVSDVI